MIEQLIDGELYFLKMNGEVTCAPYWYDRFMQWFSDEEGHSYTLDKIDAVYLVSVPDENAEGWNVIHPR